MAEMGPGTPHERGREAPCGRSNRGAGARGAGSAARPETPRELRPREREGAQPWAATRQTWLHLEALGQV